MEILLARKVVPGAVVPKKGPIPPHCIHIERQQKEKRVEDIQYYRRDHHHHYASFLGTVVLVDDWSIHNSHW